MEQEPKQQRRPSVGTPPRSSLQKATRAIVSAKPRAPIALGPCRIEHLDRALSEQS